MTRPMQSFVLLTSSAALALISLSSFAQAPAQGPSTAAFPPDGATPAPPASAPPPTAPPPAAPPPAAPPAPTSVSPGASPSTPPPAAPPPAAGEPPPLAPPSPAGNAVLAPGAALPPPTPAESLSTAPAALEPIWPPRLVKQPGWFGGLEAYGGLLVQAGADTRESYAFAGGQLRLRYDYFEFGGYYELSDRGKELSDAYRAFGGFAGAWLPYRGWVDFELAASIGARTYDSNDSRYGADGYEVSTPTLGLRLGVFDRTSSYSAFAARIGGQILASFDLNPSDEPWTLSVGEDENEVTKTGSTHVGGFTVGLALVIGFDYGRAITPSPAASTAPK
jgi:hypothetical protein